MIFYFSLFSVIISFILLLFLFNRSYFFTKAFERSSVIAFYNKNIDIFDLKFIYVLGSIIYNLFPKSLTDKLESDYFYLSKSKRDIFKDLAVASFVFSFLFLFFFLTKNIFYLISGFLFFSFYLSRVSLEKFLEKQSLDIETLHLAKCLKVLIIKTETPVNAALQNILKDLPTRMKVINRVIRMILAASEKTSLKNALLEWQTESAKFKDLISILLAAQDGSNKKAIKNSLDSFINNFEEEIDENLKYEAENLQLYLSGPIILIFLVLMYPMVAAINYMMQGTNFL